jgi:hypothetical protein
VNFPNIVTGLIIMGIMIGLTCWGLAELINYLFIDDNVIRSSMPITPELEIIVKDNLIDTIYIYRQP